MDKGPAFGRYGGVGELYPGSQVRLGRIFWGILLRPGEPGLLVAK
jgi:hypothetical protein